MSVRLGERRRTATGGSPVVALWLRAVGARIGARVARIALRERDPAAGPAGDAVDPKYLITPVGPVRLAR